MSDAIAVVVQVLLLIVLSWVVVFGGFGAALAKHRGGWWVEGFVWGTVLGPVGWVVVVLRTRGAEDDEAISFAQWSGTDNDLPETGRGDGTDDFFEEMGL